MAKTFHSITKHYMKSINALFVSFLFRINHRPAYLKLLVAFRPEICPLQKITQVKFSSTDESYAVRNFPSFNIIYANIFEFPIK